MSQAPADPDELETLAPAFAEGSAEAFDAVARLAHAQLSRLTQRLLGWDGDCDDVMQEVWISAWRHRRGFRRQCRLTTWLTKLVLNRCRSHRRGVWRRLARFVTGVDEQSVSRQPTPVESASARESADRVRQAIGQLSPTLREVVVLRLLEGLGSTEAADLLGLTASVVDVRLSRGRAELKRMLAGVLDVAHA